MRDLRSAWLFLFLLLPLLVGSAEPPRIAVACSEPDVDAEISQRAARAPYILIFDHEANLVETLDNRDVQAGGAGLQTAGLLQGKEVTHFVATRFGPNLIRGLEAAGIEYVEMEGSAQEAVRELLDLED